MPPIFYKPWTRKDILPCILTCLAVLNAYTAYDAANHKNLLGWSKEKYIQQFKDLPHGLRETGDILMMAGRPGIEIAYSKK